MFVKNIVLIFYFLVEFSNVLGMCVCSKLEGKKVILVINLKIDFMSLNDDWDLVIQSKWRECNWIW